MGLDNDAGFPLHAQIYRSYAQVNGGDGIPASGFTSDIVIRANHADTIFPDIQSALRQMNLQQVAYGAKPWTPSSPTRWPRAASP